MDNRKYLDINTTTLQNLWNKRDHLEKNSWSKCFKKMTQHFQNELSNLKSQKQKQNKTKRVAKKLSDFSQNQLVKRHSLGLKLGLSHSKAVIFSLWLLWINKPQNQFEKEKSWRSCESRNFLKLKWGCSGKWWLSYLKSRTSNIKNEAEQFIHQAHVLSYFNLFFLRTGTCLSEHFLGWLTLVDLLELS